MCVFVLNIQDICHASNWTFNSSFPQNFTLAHTVFYMYFPKRRVLCRYKYVHVPVDHQTKSDHKVHVTELALMYLGEKARVIKRVLCEKKCRNLWVSTLLFVPKITQARRFPPSQQLSWQWTKRHGNLGPHGMKTSAAGLQCARAWMATMLVRNERDWVRNHGNLCTRT